VRAYLESARANIAARLDIEDAATIFFTASGSESNNTFIKGVAFKNIDSDRKEIITTPYEHKAILRVVEYLSKFGFIPRYAQLDSSGLVDTDHLKSIVNENTLLVSIMASNNEVGTILPIHEYHNIVREQSDALFHSDMSQTIGKVENISISDLDSVTITAHKFGGPIGISALYLKDRDCLDPLIHGGNQEFNKRAGTYNAPLVSGMNIAFMELEKLDFARIAKLRDYLDEQLLANFECRINCKDVERMVNTTSVTFKDFIGDELIEFLSGHGIFISSSSACTSHEKNPSHVLKALGMTDEEAYKTVRVSLNRYSSKEEIDIFIDTVKQFKR
jgi:cysteine desulfurase